MEVVARLLAASREQRVLDCAGAVVSAGDIRAACLEAAPDPFGLRLSHARIEGALDLRAFDLAAPLEFASCDFTGPVDVSGARLHELVIAAPPDERRVLPGLIANGVRIARDLVLSGMVITGSHATTVSLSRRAAVWVAEAEIGGRFLAHGTSIEVPGGRAMHCDRTTVAGEVHLSHGFRATGEVRWVSVHLMGSLDLSGAQFLPRDGRALDLAGARIGGSIFLLESLESQSAGRRCRIRGRVELRHATIEGQIFARHADLAGTPSGAHLYNAAESGQRRLFLWAPRLAVGGAILLEGDTVVRGGLHLRGARIGGGVRMDGAVWNPDDVALDLAQAEVGGVQAVGVSIEGQIVLDNARVDGPVRVERSTLSKPPARRCLTAVNCRVAGDVRLTGLNALGGLLDFRGASISGVFSADDAFVSNPGDRTVNLHMAHVRGNVQLCGAFHSIGLVVLSRATVDSRLRCDGATLHWRDAPAPLDPPPEGNARGFAFAAVSARISGVLLGWTVHGGVDFVNAESPSLADRPDRDWPPDSELGGFRYERFASVDGAEHAVWDAGARIAWLSRLGHYDPRAWEQLALVLRTAGDRAGAEAVLVAQRRHARHIGLIRWRLFDVLQDVTVRYGFRPQRALYLLVALIAAVTVSLSLPATQAHLRATDQAAVVYTPAGPLPGQSGDIPAGPCGDGKVRCLNPFFYAIDTVVPLIDLHQRDTWYPIGRILEWWLNLCTILGWVASTVFALSFTRLGRAGGD